MSTIASHVARTALFALAAAAALPSHAQANLLVNGSFEDPTGYVDNGPNFGDQVMNLNAGATTMAGWTVFNGDVSWAAGNGYGLTAMYGTHMIDLTGYEMTPFGGVRQTFTTAAGQAYHLSFAMGYGGDLGVYSGPNTARARLLDGATVIVSQDFTSGRFQGRPTHWDTMGLDFVATSSSTTLEFQGVSPAWSQFIGIDNVSVTAVPEPAHATLLLGGLGLLAALRRRTAR